MSTSLSHLAIMKKTLSKRKHSPSSPLSPPQKIYDSQPIPFQTLPKEDQECSLLFNQISLAKKHTSNNNINVPNLVTSKLIIRNLPNIKGRIGGQVHLIGGYKREIIQIFDKEDDLHPAEIILCDP